jgi:hypothetical protein
MKTFNVRLKQLIEILGYSSARKFDMEIGAVESQTASVTGPKQITPKIDYIQKVKSRFPHVNLDWLISGEGEMFNVSQEEKTKVLEDNKKLEAEVQDLRSKLDGLLMMASMANQHTNF